MVRTWQLQEAKNKLSEVIDQAINEGPQVITRHGIEAAIVLSCTEYRQMQIARTPLSTFFRTSPLAGADLDLTRDISGLREDVAL
jgi:prevent-host-death family protein